MTWIVIEDNILHRYSVEMHEYFEKWNLESVIKITSTHTSNIYTAKCSGKTVVLKLLNTLGIKDEAAGGDLLEWYGGHGAIRLLNKDSQAQLLEYADGGELAELVRDQRDNEACNVICTVVKQLHEPRSQPTPGCLKPLKFWFKELFHEANNSGTVNNRLAAEMARYLLETTDDPIPLHGDLHHHNLLLSQRGWVAIDPKGLVGDPCYDLANFYCNPIGCQKLWQKAERINMLTDGFVKELGYPRERILQYAFVHCVVSTIWDGATNEKGTPRLAVADVIRTEFL